ncbi:37S ribosomal protein S5 [Talaromyces proteolyticus]|uniref:Small ribosomal subunit protein uS5m n=1 Tax=Talaromyces proteolyticus TaxID=1131652 RepID=A0AAD4Q121_9EURO|nr:37S ribosomal protein S5 [Talaromyces proteolyticus]KAH8705145.1 37S ribosomal protein S5 [Talaromyces proteolyticus]
MTFARPARCLFCSFSRIVNVGARVPRRQFHAAPIYFNQKPKQPEPPVPVPDPQENKTLDEIEQSLQPSDFKPYTEEEMARLSEEYSKEQVAAILAGEEAIDPKDLAEQFGIRTDPMKLYYLDDFSAVEPVVDKHIRAPESNSDWNATLKTEDDFAEDFVKFFAEMPEKPTAADWIRFTENLRLTKGKEENERNPSSALVPELFGPGESLSKEPSSKDVDKQRDKRQKTGKSEPLMEELTDAMKRLMQSTGYSLQEITNFKLKTLVSHSVVNQTRLGKVRRQYVLSIAGNGDGLLGIGEAKSEEISDAILQSKYRAIRNMQPILRYENRTIYGDVQGKVGAVELKLMNRPPGFGLRCQHLIYEMARAAGIHDLAARVDRSRNPMNTVKAVYEALISQKDPEDIARARGRKLVDVRKVYYAGKV